MCAACRRRLLLLLLQVLLAAAVVSAADVAAAADRSAKYANIAKQLITSTGESRTQQYSLAKKGSNQVRSQSYKKDLRTVDISSLTVCEVDVNNKVARCQGACTMEDLVRCTLSLGLAPKVAPEFRKITVGGAIVGASLESTSHRHGQLNDCLEYMIVALGSGEVVKCTREDNADLFHAIPGSYGTLGIVLEAGIQLENCTPHVRVEYRLFESAEDGIYQLQQLSQQDPRPYFIEAVQFPSRELLRNRAPYASPGKCPLGPVVHIVGDYHQINAGESIIRLSFPWGLWFFERCWRWAVSKKPAGQPGCVRTCEFIVPTMDYIFRWDRGAFWMAKPMAFQWQSLTPATAVFSILSCPFFVCRLLFRWLFTTRRLYSLLHIFSTKVLTSYGYAITFGID
jgi:hypothetical protein